MGPLERDDVAGKYKFAITALEFAAIIVNIIVFECFVEVHESLVIVLYTDSLTSALDMADDTAQAELMRDLVEYLRQMPAFKRLRKHLLILHAYGDTNIISDAMSRGYSAVASAFAQQLNITLFATKHVYTCKNHIHGKIGRGRDAPQNLTRCST